MLSKPTRTLINYLFRSSPSAHPNLLSLAFWGGGSSDLLLTMISLRFYIIHGAHLHTACTHTSLSQPHCGTVSGWKSKYISAFYMPDTSEGSSCHVFVFIKGTQARAHTHTHTTIRMIFAGHSSILTPPVVVRTHRCQQRCRACLVHITDQPRLRRAVTP